jgi:hypothetical protein
MPLGCTVTLPDDIFGNANGNSNANANTNDNDGGGGPDLFELTVYASNTGELTGLALRPADGALFGVNANGLFGPIEAGGDLSMMTPFGATNLADADLFDAPPSSLSLAITNGGEFWIGSPCCTTLAVVPPEGGDAEPFLGLFDVQDSKPEVIVRVPDGFTGDQIFPGQLLLGHETTFSRLFGVDVEGDRAVIAVDNPDAASRNRHAHHLTFGLDGVFYSSRTSTALTQAGFQTIAVDGRPTDLPGTLGIAGDAFVALANGDLVIRGTHQITATSSERGILLYDAEADEATLGLAISAEELSDADDMVVTPDGSMILLSLPNRNEIVEVNATGGG